ncbi:MAG: hypothetical protein JXB13_16280 [Phycisphaerae bacterium]|nr:hypothetical protein [Phycisphaerae bacterium]
MAISICMLFPLVAVLGIVGVVLLVRGVRGRRVGDHPLCARCGYDLFGSTPETTTCPECGADRTQPGAVRIGRLQRRRGSIIAGVILLVPVGALVSASMSRVNWIQITPVSWLRASARAGTGPASDRALKELVRRLNASELSSEQVDTLVSDALKVQADVTRTWQPDWGNIIETARALGAVSDEDWQTYAKQALASAFTLEIRPKVRRGDPVVYRVRRASVRAGDGEVLLCLYDLRETRLGEIIRIGRSGGGGHLNAGGTGAFGSFMSLSPEEWTRISDGRHNAEMTLACTVREHQPNRDPDEGPVITEQSITLTSPWEVVGADHPTVTVTSPPEHREAVRDSLADIELTRRKQADGTPYLEGIFSLDQPPMDLAFDVVLRSGLREWKQGTVSIVAGGNTHWSTSSENVPDADVMKVDVIFVPSEEVARQTVDLTNIWGETVIIPDVPIESDPSAKR